MPLWWPVRLRSAFSLRAPVAPNKPLIVSVKRLHKSAYPFSYSYSGIRSQSTSALVLCVSVSVCQWGRGQWDGFSLKLNCLAFYTISMQKYIWESNGCSVDHGRRHTVIVNREGLHALGWSLLELSVSEPAWVASNSSLQEDGKPKAIIMSPFFHNNEVATVYFPEVG